MRSNFQKSNSLDALFKKIPTVRRKMRSKPFQHFFSIIRPNGSKQKIIIQHFERFPRRKPPLAVLNWTFFLEGHETEFKKVFFSGPHLLFTALLKSRKTSTTDQGRPIFLLKSGDFLADSCFFSWWVYRGRA